MFIKPFQVSSFGSFLHFIILRVSYFLSVYSCLTCFVTFLHASSCGISLFFVLSYSLFYFSLFEYPTEIAPFLKEETLNTTLEQRITYSIGELINRFSTFYLSAGETNLTDLRTNNEFKGYNQV